MWQVDIEEEARGGIVGVHSHRLAAQGKIMRNRQTAGRRRPGESHASYRNEPRRQSADGNCSDGHATHRKQAETSTAAGYEPHTRTAESDGRNYADEGGRPPIATRPP